MKGLILLLHTQGLLTLVSADQIAAVRPIPALNRANEPTGAVAGSELLLSSGLTLVVDEVPDEILRHIERGVKP